MDGRRECFKNNPALAYTVRGENMVRETIPILYPSDETAFNSNGYGFLADGISCEVTEELNAGFELHLEYPVTGVYYDLLSIGNIICSRTNTHNAKTQPFRIYRVTKPTNGVITVYAQHISYDVYGYTVGITETQYEKSYADVSTIIEFLNNAVKDYIGAVGGLEFAFDTNGEFEAAPWSVTSFTTVKSVMQQAAKMYNGQWLFDGTTCTLCARRGEDRGVSIDYGRNLSSLTEDEDMSETYTNLMPFYRGRGEDDEEIIIGGLNACISTGTSIAGYTKTKPLDSIPAT